MDIDPHESAPSWFASIPKFIDFAGDVLAYLYLLRVPILMSALLIGLPLLTLISATTPIAGNLFLLSPANVFYAMIAAFMLAWSIMVVTRVVLLNGIHRFKLNHALRRDVLRWWSMVCVFLLAVPIFAASVIGPTRDPQWPQRLVWGLAGLLVAYVVGCFTLVLAVLFAPQYKDSAKDRFPNLLPWYRWLLGKAYDQRVLPQAILDKFDKWGGDIPVDLSGGYLDPVTHRLYPGHWFSFLMLIASFVLFWLVGFGKQNHLGETTFPVPAIGYVLLLLLVINWILSMAAFFLDRFRVPLLLPLAILCVAGNSALRSDHYYFVQRGVSIKTISPVAVLTAPRRVSPVSREHPHGRVVVIATAGGGIQAAAWTARVLTGLQEQLPEFSNSIAALSAVSGGAVGTMFFVNQYQSRYDVEGFPTHWSEDLSNRVVKDAESSSLDDVAWALVYSDFFRIFFPYLKHSTEDSLIDRGWALEQTWRNRANIQANLSNWRDGVLEGWRPAVIFNSTIAETGEALLLSTSDISPGPENQQRPRTFSELYPNTDLPIVTAVRLAATFPYVTPSARAVSTKPEYHMVDGGYYDNYGVFTLLNWLDEALDGIKKGDWPDVLFIQIRSFPSDHLPDPAYTGWFYQTYAPLDALFDVRTNAQKVRDQYELARFRERWSLMGAKIRNATFQFDGTGAPLSWAMNPEQNKAIDDQWHERIFGKPGATERKIGDWMEVRCFFRPDEPDCKNRPVKEPW
jgi:hypothetical protein